MICIDFTELPDGVSLKVSGHSGYAPTGEDIVCSAVSALVYTFTGGVESVLGASVIGKLESGSCDLIASVANEKQDTLKKLFEVFKFGFRKIEKSYPGHVILN